jgi:hypothetical protein
MGRIRLISSYGETLDARIRTAWVHLLEQSYGETLFYQSPSYFDHLASQTCNCEPFLVCAEGKDGSVTGLMPFVKTAPALNFQVGGIKLGGFSFSGVRMLGCGQTFPQSPALFDALFGLIAASISPCDAIELKCLPASSALLAYLKGSSVLRREFMLYAPDGLRECHTLGLPQSYEGYLSGFKRKKRYNLKRQIRCLNEWGDGSLSVCRVQTAEDAHLLLHAFEALGLRGKKRINDLPGDAEIIALARRGLLMSYVMSVRGHPCAVAFGTTFMGTLLIHMFATDRQIARFSPGTVLNVLLIRDLIDCKLVRKIDYGFGEPRYRLSNDVDQRVTVLLVRKTVANCLSIMAHKFFVWLLNQTKRLAQFGANCRNAAKTESG